MQSAISAPSSLSCAQLQHPTISNLNTSQPIVTKLEHKVLGKASTGNQIVWELPHEQHNCSDSAVCLPDQPTPLTALCAG